MKINRDNYEQYFLDHAEGNLSPEMERELFIFLEANPDLKNVLEDFDASPLFPAEIKNDALKKRLKKNIHPTLHINEANVDEWLIGQAEGLLDDDGTIELKDFLALNPAFVYDQKLFSLAKVEPDLSVKFSRKNQLKKKAPVFILSRIAWTVSAAAAMILLIIGIRFFNRPEVIDMPKAVSADVRPSEEIPLSQPVLTAVKQDVPETKSTIVVNKKPAIQLASINRTSASRMDPIEPKPFPVEVPIQEKDIFLVAYTPTPISNTEKEEKKLLAKVFGNLVAQARDALRNNENLDKLGNANINIWSIAEAGVKGFNTISDRDLELMVRKDEDGKITSYALVEQDRLLITKSLDKN